MLDLITIVLLVVIGVAIYYVYTVTIANQSQVKTLLGNVQQISTVTQLQTNLQNLIAQSTVTNAVCNVNGTPLNTTSPNTYSNSYPIGESKFVIVQYSLSCTPTTTAARTSVTFALYPKATSHNLLSVSGMTASGIDIGSIRSVIDPVNMLITISFNATDQSVHTLGATYIVMTQ